MAYNIRNTGIVVPSFARPRHEYIVDVVVEKGRAAMPLFIETVYTA